MSDDFTNNIFTTGVLTLGGASTKGVNEINTDDDWFRMDLPRYYTVEISLESDSAHSMPATELKARLMDQSGQVAHTRSGTHLPRSFRFAASDAGGTFFMSVFEGDGAYRVSATIVDDYRPNYRNFISLSETDFGAIETVGDEDLHVVQLLKDYTYTINIYGQDTSDATLKDPRVQLLKKDGTLIAEDDNSGEGNNARLSFTPAYTDFYRINVLSADGGTGSYVVDIPDLDDFDGDITTTGTLELGTPQKGQIFWNDEKDWFRIRLERNFTYEFSSDLDPDSPVPNRPVVQVFDNTGKVVSAPKPYFASSRKITASYSGDYFVSATGGAGGYLLNGEIVDDFPDVKNAKYTKQRYLPGAIEEAGDQDGFLVPLASGVSYEINVLGQAVGDHTLSDPFLGVYTGKDPTLLASDNDSGVGKNSKLIFTPTENTLFQLGVTGNNQTTGSYTLSLQASDDFAGNSQTESVLVLSDRAAQTSGALEFGDDIDWHAIDLKKDCVYHIRSDVDEIGIRDTQSIYQSGSKVDSTTIAFRAEATGRHYIVTRREVHGNPRPMSYGLQVTEFVPQITARRMPQLIGNDSRIGRYVRTNTRVLDGDQFEVFSETWLELDQQSIAPKQLLSNLTLAEFSNLKVVDNFKGQAQVWVRTKPQNFKQWSNWDSVPVYGTQIPEALTATKPQKSIYFSFATTRPEYYHHNTSFQELTNSEKNIVRQAIGYWDEALGIDFIERNQGEGDGTTNSEMMIFKSDLGGAHTFGHYPRTEAGNDLRLSSTTAVMQADWREGSQAFYEILRGIGSSLGLKPNSNQNRTETLMGLRSDRASWFLPYPSRPLPQDTLLIENDNSHLFGISGNKDNTVYEMAGPKFLRTIVDGFGNDTIDASGQSLQTRIDLRPGAMSYSGFGIHRPHTFVNSHYAYLENAIGGPLRDVIVGSNLGISNRLEGRDGNDFLKGMQGNDQLFGGRHDDTYYFQMGHGDDRIDEQDLGGFDRLIIQGLHNFDSVADDLLFRRLGNDLIVKLELDGQGGQDSGSIQIRNMGSPASRVERLDLLNTQFDIDGKWLAHISLPSVFAQADENFRAFELANGWDASGRLTQPV